MEQLFEPGETLDFFQISMREAVDRLSSNLDRLGQNDRRFAESLIETYRARTPTPKQRDWIYKMLERALSPKPEPKTEDIGDMAGAIALFDIAGKKLKHPAVVISKGELTLRLSVAGQNSKRPGTINVTSDGAWAFRTWFGRITREGSFEASMKANPGPDVTSLLKEFAVEPAKVAARHGRLKGCCSFCDTPLTDARSLYVGYGPTCARNWGLSYPKKSELDALIAEEAADAASTGWEDEAAEIPEVAEQAA